MLSTLDVRQSCVDCETLSHFSPSSLSSPPFLLPISLQLHCYTMSLQGPVVSMQPVSIMSGSPTHPINKHLMSTISRRERSSSSSDVSSLPVAQSRLLPLPPSPFDSIQRSQSMPRGANLLPEPHLHRSLPVSKSTEFRKIVAQSRIRRAETVETYTLSKEDFEVPEVKIAYTFPCVRVELLTLQTVFTCFIE